MAITINKLIGGSINIITGGVMSQRNTWVRFASPHRKIMQQLEWLVQMVAT